MTRFLPRILSFLVALVVIFGLADAVAARLARSIEHTAAVERTELPREWRWEKKAQDFEFLWRVKGPREGRQR